MNWNRRIVACWTAAVVVVAAIISVIASSRNAPPSTTYSRFLDLVREGNVSSVVIEDRGTAAARAIFRQRDGRSGRLFLPPRYEDALATLRQATTEVEIRDATRAAWMNAIPFFVLLAVWLVLFLRFRRSGGFPLGRAF